MGHTGSRHEKNWGSRELLEHERYFMHLEFTKWVFARDSWLGFSSYFSAENLQRQKDLSTPSQKLQQSPSHAPTPTPVNGRTLLLSLNVSVIFRCILTFCVTLHEEIHSFIARCISALLLQCVL